MSANKRDVAHLWDLREAARDCLEFTKNATYEKFCADRMMHSAVERKLEILGEAAGHVSEEFQLSYSVTTGYPGPASETRYPDPAG